MGTHVVRVTPDLALVSVAVTRLADQPAEAFSATREGARGVREALDGLDGVDLEVRSSRITLETRYRRGSNKSEVIGHQGIVEISVTFADLDQIETVLVAMVDNGADRVRSVRFKSTRLRELRATARREAIGVARSKAEVFAEAAGVKLGKVLHIEDVDPGTTVRRNYGHLSDTDLSDPADASGGPYDPGTIPVTGSVVVSYAIL